VFSQGFVLSFHKLIVDGLETLAQVQDCIMLARQQRVHTESSLCRQLLEAVSHQLMGDECFPLLDRQFIESVI
jgi:hypothetical protein